jgi:hypothetical protein
VNGFTDTLRHMQSKRQPDCITVRKKTQQQPTVQQTKAIIKCSFMREPRVVVEVSGLWGGVIEAELCGANIEYFTK